MMSSTSSSLVLLFLLCLASYACNVRAIRAINNENEPATSSHFSIKNKEKQLSLAAVVVASNPRPSISKASESTKIHGIPPKIDKNEEKSSLAGVVIASNPKPSISKRSESAKVHKPLVENDKNEEKSLKTSKLTFAESPAQKHDLKGDNKRSNVEADDVKAKSADDFQVDYAPPRTHPPHHNIKFN